MNINGYKSLLPNLIKGMGMGAADVVPGVSGGTIAFITGIYEELINSIKNVPFAAKGLLQNRNFKSFWKDVNGKFLLSVFLGIGISIISLARVIKFMLLEYPVALNGFFFGLIAASAVVLGMEIKNKSISSYIVLIAGIAVAYFISTATPASTPDSAWFIFLSGSIAICAMILPGISGSFILLLMGKYQMIIEAVSDADIYLLVVFAAGCAVGLLTFAQLLSWLFKRFKSVTMALLTGFMTGSLAKVWPWKNTLEFRINSKGEKVPFLEDNILPGDFAGDPMIMTTLFLALFGAGLVLSLQFISTKKETV